MSDSSYNFDAAFKKAFPTPAKTSPFDFSSALANSGVKREVTTTELVTSGPTVSAAPGTTPSSSNSGRRQWDPHGDFNFVVEIDGKEAGAFQKCDGLSFEMDVIEFRDSMDPYPRYRPGIRRFGRIRLTKGYVSNTELWDWCQDIIHGKPDRRHGAIHLLNDDGSEAVTYRFLDALPVKWSGFRFDGKGQGSAVEEIELVTECVIRD